LLASYVATVVIYRCHTSTDHYTTTVYIAGPDRGDDRPIISAQLMTPYNQEKKSRRTTKDMD